MQSEKLKYMEKNSSRKPSNLPLTSVIDKLADTILLLVFLILMVLLTKQTRDEKEYEYEHDEFHGDYDYKVAESEIGVRY